jgi:predicted lipid-binding transport protein (Tim44 family)
LKNLISAVLIAMMLLFATAGVVIASEKTTHEVSETENKINEQAKNASVTQNVTEEAKEAAAKKQPGFEAAFAAVGLLAVAFVALKKRN